MPSILKIRRDWSLLHFEIRRDTSLHNFFKIRRDRRTPLKYVGKIGAQCFRKDGSFGFGGMGVPLSLDRITNRYSCTKMIKAYKRLGTKSNSYNRPRLQFGKYERNIALYIVVYLQKQY